MSADIILTNDGLQFANGSVQSFAMGRNRIINGNFGINQRVYVSGAAVGAGLYGHDRWKMAASGDTYTFSTTANVTTVTIPAGKVLQQVIEGLNLESGTYTLSWTGTAQGKIGAGSYGASGITGVIVGGTNTTIEFNTGTVSKVQLEFGSTVSLFERRPVGLELALCQRYFEKSYAPDVAAGTALAGGFSSFVIPTALTTGQSGITFRVTKRVNPTMSGWNAVSGAAGAVYRVSDAVSVGIVAFNFPGPTGVGEISISTASVNGYYLHWTATAEL